MSVRTWSRIARRAAALLVIAVVLTSCGSWKGIANVPLPGGPGTGSKKMTIYVQMPDTLALNVNSRVRVADVYRRPGALDRAEELGRDADPGPAARRQAAGELAGEDRTDQLAGQPARSARPAAGSVPAAVEER